MFFKFFLISSKKTNVSSSMRPLGSCFPSRVVRFGAAMVAAALLPAIASASPILPDPIYNIRLGQQASAQTFAAPGTYTFGGVSTTVSGMPGAAVIGHALGAGDISNSVDSAMFYSYTVDGPLAGVPVPLLVTVTLHASASGPFTDTAVALFRVTEAQSFLAININVNASNNDPSLVGEFSGTVPFNEMSGRVGTIELGLSIATNVGGVADASAGPPFIFIDPEFLSSHPGYSVVVSPGTGNPAPAPPVPGVPEPATLVLLASGLLGSVALRFVAERRRRVQAGSQPRKGPRLS